MCFTHDVIERQALKICEEMKMHTIYCLVGIAITGGQIRKIQENTSIESSFNLLPGEAFPLITKVMLQDANGSRIRFHQMKQGFNLLRVKLLIKNINVFKLKKKDS